MTLPRLEIINSIINTKGLSYYWAINGSTTDYQGGQDMKIEQNGYLTADRFGNPGGALLLSHGFASVPPAIYFDPTKGGYTFMAWIKVLSWNDWQRIFDFGNGQENNNVLLAFPEKTNTLKLDTYNVGPPSNGYFSSAISLNTWSHVAVSVVGETSTFFINGLQRGSGSGNDVQYESLYFNLPERINFFNIYFCRKISNSLNVIRRENKKITG